MPRRFIAALCLVATACLACPSDGGEVADPTPSSTTTPPAPVPPRGTIAIGVLGEPATFDPHAELASDLTHWLARRERYAATSASLDPNLS